MEYSADGTTFRTIVEGNEQEPFDVTYDDSFQNPQLSPDGKYIAYEGQFTYVFDFYIVDRETGELLAGYYTDEIGIGFVRPTWTPDNRIVVAGSHNTPGLYILDQNWEELTRFDPNLANPDQPEVSPNGERVAFVMNNHIYTLKLDGTGLQQITNSDWEESWPTWS